MQAFSSPPMPTPLPTAAPVARQPPPITPRKPALALADAARHWVGGSPAATQIGNGVNLLFPYGERFFVRSVHHFVPQLTDEALKARIKGFFGQEGRHASVHDDQAQVLRDQGYEIDSFLARYQRISAWLEARTSPVTRLAMTAAAEHFTAIMAADALGGDAPILKVADPVMAQLLGWHAAEEIEHKSVAFDVLTAVDPSYARRVQGLALATLMLGGMWAMGTVHLWKQEGLSVRAALRELRAMRAAGKAAGQGEQSIALRVFARGIREYLRRDFHPDAVDNYHLAQAFFAAHGADLGLAPTPTT